MNKFVVCFLAAGLAVAAQGANRYWYGTGDLTRPFTDPTNWKDSTPPVPGDNVLLRSYGKDLVVSDDDAALASTVSIIWDVNSHTVQDSLIWNVSTNASFSGIFGDWAGSKGFKTGRFIKRGTGDLNLVAGPSLGTTSYKSPHWVVERGVLRYPQFTTAPYAGWAAGETVVSNGATLVLLSGLDKETTTTFTKLVNYGVVTNECANRVTLATGGDVDDPSEIYGTILGNLRYTPYGSVNIYSTAIADMPADFDNQYGSFRMGPAFLYNAFQRELKPEDWWEGKTPWHTTDYAHACGRGRGVGSLRLEFDLFQSMAARYFDGAARFCQVAASLPQGSAAREKALRQACLGEYMARAVLTTKHIREGELAERAGDRAQATAIAHREQANVRAAIELLERDSRLGWEPTMGYQAGAEACRWKLSRLERLYGKGG